MKENTIQQKYPKGILLIILFFIAGITTTTTTSIAIDTTQLGPWILTGLTNYIISLVYVICYSVCIYGLILKSTWAKKVTVAFISILITLSIGTYIANISNPDILAAGVASLPENITNLYEANANVLNNTMPFVITMHTIWHVGIDLGILIYMVKQPNQIQSKT